MIRRIRKITWTQPDGKLGYCYHVYYKNTKEPWRADRHRVYSFNQNLPMTVLNFLLNAATVTTTYTDTGKVEDYA